MIVLQSPIVAGSASHDILTYAGFGHLVSPVRAWASEADVENLDMVDILCALVFSDWSVYLIEI